MDKTTQNLAWSVLQKEFKEEVKEIYSNAITYHPCGYNHKTDLLKYLFGRHNLISKAEGEESLTCEKYKVEEALNYCDELDSISGSHNMRNWGEQMIAYLFGSKCLPDETCNVSSKVASSESAKPKFKVGDKVQLKDVYEIDEVDEDMERVSLKGSAYMEDFDNLEHYTEPTYHTLRLCFGLKFEKI